MITMQQIRRRKWWLGIALALSAGTGYAHAQEPLVLEQPPAAPVPAPSVQPPKPEERIEFQKRAERWNAVLEWLSEKTGLPVIGTPPDGTFQYIAPKAVGDAPKKTIPEIIDIINEALLDKHYMLIRSASLMMSMISG